MDVETAEAVDTLRGDIHHVEREVVRAETSLTAKIAHVETALTGKIERVETALTAKIERVETSLTAKIERVETSLTAKIERVETSLTARMDEHKRHADVRFESLHDDIRLIAEAVASLSVKVDTLHR